jgi:hypothetical protein
LAFKAEAEKWELRHKGILYGIWGVGVILVPCSTGTIYKLPKTGGMARHNVLCFLSFG